MTKLAPPRNAPRLYLATPVIEDAAAFAQQLPAAFAAADVAAVLVRLAGHDPRAMMGQIQILAPLVQAAGAALLLDGHVDLVARAGADGAHLFGLAELQEALPSLKPQRIAGVGGLSTRHDAMTAGESGADYVLFGDADSHGHRPSSHAIAERLQWWAELFEPPCVGFAATVDEARIFAEAGADFILADDFIWSDSRGTAAALSDMQEAIAKGFAAAPGKTIAHQD